MDITKLTLIELKALCYDLIIQKEQAQLNLQAVNQEIQKRIKEGGKDEPKPVRQEGNAS